MFGNKAINRIIRWIGLVVLCGVLAVVVRIVGRGKLEAGRTGIVSDKAVMVSVVEGSQKKGGRPSEVLRLAPLAQNDARKKLQHIYTSQIGIREKTGKNDGPDVEKYLRYIGLSKGYSYCAAYVCWCLNEARIDNPKNGWAPALFPAKRVVWERNQQRSVMPSVAEASQKKGGPDNETHSIPLRSTQGDVEVGDVFGLYFTELKRIAHCGFVDSWNGTWMISVEANTNDIGSVILKDEAGNPIRAGPGEGVYRKKRLVKTIYKIADWVSE